MTSGHQGTLFMRHWAINGASDHQRELLQVRMGESEEVQDLRLLGHGKAQVGSLQRMDRTSCSI